MKKISIMVAISCLAMSFFAGAASAKDEVLLQDMATLDQKYIRPLFMTSQVPQKATEAIGTMNAYVNEWNYFYNSYANYRPNEVNWIDLFNTMDDAVFAAAGIVQSCKENLDVESNSCPGINLQQAHEELEVVRETMKDLRTRNGFPKFVTDKLTAFHEPMEAIVLSLRSPDVVIDEEMIANLEELLDECYFLWKKVEDCPVDMYQWGYTDADEFQYQQLVQNVYNKLNAFAAALASGNEADMVATSMPIKKAFVPVMLFFGGIQP